MTAAVPGTECNPLDAGPLADEAADRLHGMVGRSPAMQRVFEQISRLARSNAPVLIVGETGTGKELVARAIHQLGARAVHPYVAINCAALPGEMVESELFGHRRGAFSGAEADHPGLFRAAAGGTVLLDEITEMSPALQAKLLRVLQERKVRAVGGLTEVPIDVRIIASSNRDPDTVLRDGQLRADLYYRLAASVIALPPLRLRRDDIPLLVDHFLAGLCEHDRCGLDSPPVLSREANEALLAHAWPGNVRELFNVLERACGAREGRAIRPADLGLPTRAPLIPIANPTAPADPTCAEHERRLIEQTLRATGGNKSRAARELGISRKKLYARLARYARPQCT